MQTTKVRGAHLSLQQERLWLLPQKSNAYRTQCSVWLEGTLEVEAFRQSLTHMLEQHEIFQTVFHVLPGMALPVQVIGHQTDRGCPLIDLQDLDSSAQEAALSIHFAQLQTQPFDFAHRPLVHTFLIRLSAKKHLFLVSFSALSADAATLPLFIAEVSRRYAACLAGRQWLEEPLQYVDVSTWQNELLASENAIAPREFWEKVDLSHLSTMELPFARVNGVTHLTSQHPSSTSFEPATHTISMPKIWSEAMLALVHRSGVSLPALMLACWHLLLWRVTGERDAVIGVACDGRMYEELEMALGLYTRFVPLAIHSESSWSFEQVGRAVQESLDEALRWQPYFTWPAQQDDAPDRQSLPFFPVTFTYERWPAQLLSGDVTISLQRSNAYTEPFVLNLALRQVGEELQLELQYDTRRVTSEQVQQLAAVLHTFIIHAAQQPQAFVNSIPLLSLSAQQVLRVSFSASANTPQTLAFHQLFERQAQNVPNQLAVIDVTEGYTYRELNHAANQLAHWLRRQGVGPGVLVALYMTRSARMIMALLAILKAGGAYVPLDAESPPARLAYQLQDVQAPLLLTEQVLFSQLPPMTGTIHTLESLLPEIKQEPVGDLPLLNSAEDIAYVIYTSGSTGKPKGVMVRHGSVVNYAHALSTLLRAEPGWHYATVSTLAADLGNTAIFCALTSGGCLQVLAYTTITSGEVFARWTAEHPIDVLKIVPSHLSALLTSEQAGALLPRRALILGGEAFPLALKQRILQLDATCAVYNHYGPTEATIGVLVNAIDRREWLEDEEDQRGIVPLGRPLSGSDVYVLDPWLQLVPAGVTGELYIGGAGLAAGYLHLPEQTAERFIPHPWSQQTGARLYRTGDLVHYNLQGQIEFVGRIDYQVKLRGYRIELGEIEAALLQHPDVRLGVVLLREEEPGQAQLVAYIVPCQFPAPSLGALRTFLQDQLPSYMLPSALVSLRTLPLTANGKLDRQALPAPVSEHESDSVYVAPRTPIEDLLVSIWEEVLHVQPVGILHNFFQLGGHSLLATQIIARMQSTFGVEIPLRSIFDTPTIAALAEQVLPCEDRVALPPLISFAREGALPLSFAQQRLWFLDQLAPGDTSYNIAHALRIQGSLDRRALILAVREVVRRHEVLRTAFPADGALPVQTILSPECFTLRFCDLSALSLDSYEALIPLLADQEEQQPFHLATGPLLRVTLLSQDGQDHVLLLTMHHIVSDAWSRPILIRELSALYAAFVQNQPSPLNELPLQYVDFALWQRQWLQGEVLNTQLQYWTNQLANAAPLELVTDRPRPHLLSSSGAVQGLFLPHELAQRLVDLSHQENMTLFMTLLAAFQVLLARYTAQDDILVGTPIANRNRPEIENLIGFFTNTLIMRSDLSGNPTFREVLARVRSVALGAYAHQELPFEYLVEALQPERNLSRSPLFQVMFVHQHAQSSSSSGLQLGGTSLSPVAQTQTTSKFDLTLFTTHTTHGLRCVVEYSTDLFEATTIARLLEHWRLLLENIVEHPDYNIGSFPLLTHDELNLVLRECNNTELDIAQLGGLHTLFEIQAQATPDVIAVSDEHASLSYAALDALSNRLARYLRTRGVGPDVVVGLCLGRSLKTMLAVLAILKAGGAYLPLDPAYPVDRLAFMLQDACAPIVLTEQAFSDLLNVQQVELLLLDTLEPLLSEQDCSPLPSLVMSDHALYVIYTSGSTGQPKGVILPHRTLVNLCQWQQLHSPATSGTRTLQFTSLSFDVACQELFATWSTGGTLYLVPEEVRKDPFALVDVLQQAAIERLFLPFIALQQLALAFEQKQSFPLHLEQIITAGEQLQITRPLLDFFAKQPATLLVNQYGPSESHVATAYDLRPPASAWPALPPVGGPVANTRIYLLNEQLQLVPVGSVGELCISGDCLARGYMGNPAATADKFRPNPWSSIPGDRLYRTGDMASYRSDGAILFLGRRDHQVKIRGHRVELGEVEVALSKHPYVHENVVVVQEKGKTEKKLVAYLVAKDEIVLSTGELRAFLLGMLPEPLIPSHFVQVTELPLTPSGKVDRRALPSVESGNSSRSYTRPRDALEARLLRIWQDVLDVEDMDIHDNFFELGGHSILAVNLLACIREQLDYRLALSALFQFPTVAGMASVLRREADYTQPVLVPIQPPRPDTSRPPFFCVHAVGGTVFRYYQLARYLGHDQPFYGLQAPDLDGQGRTYETIEQLADHYITELRAVQAQGPYFLGGWSMGGVVAFEMARQLCMQGQDVALLALVDSVVSTLSGPPPDEHEALDVSDAGLARAYRDYFGISIPDPEVVPCEPEQQLHAVVEQIKVMGIFPENTDIEQSRRIMRTNVTNMYSFSHYTPQRSYPHRVTLFRAQDGVNSEDPTRLARTLTRGWETFAAAGVEVYPIPGNHSTILDEPNVQTLASSLRTCIDAIVSKDMHAE
ncbi:non-ribosomal peptide synthetase [Ktedonobacteria bacterium brp13]|nr:non-ribosomal peptide synthetase [Ktedonobacteria bacterium brp13]